MPLLIFAAMAICASGCSSFEAAWEEAARAPAAERGLEGRWQGTWRSDVNGHSGALRCILSRDPQGNFLARYHATYGSAFTFEYTVPMTAEEEGEAWKFHGSADLGWLAGGVYEYIGTVIVSDFTSTYASKSDHGIFRMTRAR